MNADFLNLMLPEISLTGLIFLLLFFKIWDGFRNPATVFHITNVLLAVILVAGYLLPGSGELFNGMFHTSKIINFEKAILVSGTLIIFLQSYDWLRNNPSGVEFCILMLSTLLGMEFMISSGNLLMFYLGLELSSIPLAAMANFTLHNSKSSEAGIKLILSSSFASAIMLFGISLLYGSTGSLTFSEIAMRLSHDQLQAFSFVLIFAGFAFKLSTVPFHLWTADVYEGAPVPVTAYLSVISKGSIVFVFISVLFSLFAKFTDTWYGMLYLSVMLTITIGNLFAMRQNNIKRFLAFSSIAQMGYILLGISAGTVVGASAAVFFLLVYTFSNLGAFGVVSFVSEKTGKENITDYRGFYTNNKSASWVLTIALFSLAGIPPTAGFFGKMFLVTAGAAKGNYALIGMAALNMVLSLYYYLRVVKAIFMEKNDEPIEKLSGSLPLKIAFAICMVGIVGTGFATGLFEYINTITGQ
jgi:NADH-quinone oxidoreductase subunit N